MPKKINKNYGRGKRDHSTGCLVKRLCSMEADEFLLKRELVSCQQHWPREFKFDGTPTVKDTILLLFALLAASIN